MLCREVVKRHQLLAIFLQTEPHLRVLQLTQVGKGFRSHDTIGADVPVEWVDRYID